MASASVLVTGGAGFIGSHVCAALLARGAHVTALDNLDDFYAESLKRANLDEVSKGAQAGAFAFERCDIRDGAALRAAFERVRPSAVIHLAARAGVRPSIERPGLYAQVNVEGTVQVLESCRHVGVARVLVASSSSVYGNASVVPFAETADISRPISPYAATKVATEALAHTWHTLYGAPTACLRFFTVFGPRQRPDLAIGKFMRMVARGEAIPMFGNGETSRDYTFVGDIVAGVLASLERVEKHGYRIWNLGGSSPVRLTEMIDAVASTVGKPARLERQPAQAGDVERTYADLTRSRAELGYEPRTEFREGLRAQWEWLKARL
jgi:UDP-glucuronate 4-epimerase